MKTPVIEHLRLTIQISDYEGSPHYIADVIQKARGGPEHGELVCVASPVLMGIEEVLIKVCQRVQKREQELQAQANP